MGHVSANVINDAFRGYLDDVSGGIASQTAIAAVDTNWTQDADAKFHVAMLATETAGGSASNYNYRLEYNLNGVGWNDVTAATPIQAVSPTNCTTGDAASYGTTALTTGAAIQATEYDSGGGDGASVSLSSASFEYTTCLQIDSGQVSDSDTIQLRLTNSGTALSADTTIPTITVNIAATIHSRTAAISGASGVVASGAVTRHRAAAMASASSLSGVASAFKARTAAMVSASSLAAAASATRSRTVSAVGVSAFSALATRVLQRSVAIASASGLSVIGSVSSGVSRTAAMAGASGLTVAASVTRRRAVAIAAASGLSAVGTLSSNIGRSVGVVASSSLTVVASRVIRRTVAIAAASGVVASGSVAGPTTIARRATFSAASAASVSYTHIGGEESVMSQPIWGVQDGPSRNIYATGGKLYDGEVDDLNSSSLPLGISESFTGQWVDVARHGSIIVAVAADADGQYSIQYSPDGVEVDSTLSRHYRVGDINPPHRFTNTRKYARIVYTNGAVAQSVFRLHTMLGNFQPLNTPMDSTMARDFDATAVRPSDPAEEAALGRREGQALWHKWGYNADVDTLAPEMIWSGGGSMIFLTAAETLDVVSTDANDAAAGTGAQSVIIRGLDSSRREQTEIVTLNGTTPVTTINTWLGVNRMETYIVGSGDVNAGVITATASTAATLQAHMPAGEGTTQQGIFFSQSGHQCNFNDLMVNASKISGGVTPSITIKAWVKSFNGSGLREVFRVSVDTSVENQFRFNSLKNPFNMPESCVIYFTCETDTDNTEVSIRFSLIEYKNQDAA